MSDPGSSQTSFDTLLGRLLVDRGLATKDEVKAAAKASANDASLGAVLVKQGVVTQRQVDRLLPELDEAKAGRQIPGYQITSKLGAGAMATVYKAKQISLDRSVAIKILPKKYSKNPDFIRRFYDEGKAAAKLNHPNLVAAIDVGQSGEYHYFVMEYVDGKTVYDDIVSKGEYTEEKALSVSIQLAEALKHAHEKGFVHRDVKPKNIMFTRAGVAKLADMGLARAVSDKEAAEAEAGKAFGTPYYISPEQIRGIKDVDGRADLYSLGATIYHMVTGQVPFDGPNPSAVMAKHLKNDLIPPDHINRSLSQGMAEIIEVCMAKSREARYTDASELLTDLRLVQRGEPPTMTRRKLDLASLSDLDTAEPVEPNAIAAPVVTLTEQPLFWFAALGWAVAVVLVVLLAVT